MYIYAIKERQPDGRGYLGKFFSNPHKAYLYIVTLLNAKYTKTLSILKSLNEETEDTIKEWSDRYDELTEQYHEYLAEPESTCFGEEEYEVEKIRVDAAD